jgi:hypothetical protein
MWLTRLAFWSAVFRPPARCSGANVPKFTVDDLMVIEPRSARLVNPASASTTLSC